MAGPWPGRLEGAAQGGTAAGPAGASAATASSDFFRRHALAYAAGRWGQPIAILTAGCATAGDLGPGDLGAEGADVSVSLVDADQPATRAAVAARGLAGVTLGDLRTVPLPPRGFDIVQCSSLLERTANAELVLDRLVAALKPGGLLLLRFCDRASTAGFLDRALPQWVRRAVWRQRRPGEPGPHPAVYEPLTSGKGMEAYVMLRGLVIAESLALGGLAAGFRPGPAWYEAAKAYAARLPGGRLTAAHEELLYALRKPEDRFARVL